jgi:carbon starvation protein
MSGLAIISIATFIFILAYRFYGDTVVRIWQIDETRQTPAFTKYDGVDYIPSKNWLVLFGHHFASIAGAGPIIGPVIAVCFWGWLPALIWVILGSIFLGGIHDFGSLMMSVREEGATIGDIASRSISHKAKLILSIFTWLALILVIAVFAYLGADTFVKQPQVVLPSFGIIPVSILVGLALYQLKWNSSAVTIIGLAALAGLIVAGEYWPIQLNPDNGLAIWIILLMIYCFFASTIPVNILLQPRDYLSSFLLIGGLVLAILGILISRPVIHTPAYIGNMSDMGYLWPMMFITVACGANSGFHSLIASGTTSKQLANERDAKKIGFGAMLVEGFLATIVIVMVAGGFSSMEFQQHLASKTSPVHMYGLSFGNVTAPITGQWGTFIALMILNAFILTTLDSATRITRYITHELFGVKNRYLATLIVVILGTWLALGKDSANNPLWQTIWPAFGASNQLVAALALLVISCWLLGKNKPTLYSLLPAGFMLITSITALIFQLIQYWKNHNFLLIIVSFILIISAVFLTSEVWITFQRKR